MRFYIDSIDASTFALMLRLRNKTSTFIALRNLHHVSLIRQKRRDLVVVDSVLYPTKEDDALVVVPVSHHRNARIAYVVQTLGAD